MGKLILLTFSLDAPILLRIRAANDKHLPQDNVYHHFNFHIIEPFFQREVSQMEWVGLQRLRIQIQ